MPPALLHTHTAVGDGGEFESHEVWVTGEQFRIPQHNIPTYVSLRNLGSVAHRENTQSQILPKVECLSQGRKKMLLDGGGGGG